MVLFHLVLLTTATVPWVLESSLLMREDYCRKSIWFANSVSNYSFEMRIVFFCVCIAWIINKKQSYNTKASQKTFYSASYRHQCERGNRAPLLAACFIYSWWRHDVSMYPAFLVFCMWNPPLTGGLLCQIYSAAGLLWFLCSSLEDVLERTVHIPGIFVPYIMCDNVVNPLLA